MWLCPDVIVVGMLTRGLPRCMQRLAFKWFCGLDVGDGL